MMKMYGQILWVFLMTSGLCLRANPIPLSSISELLLVHGDNLGWILEFNTYGPAQPGEDWYLASEDDTARIEAVWDWMETEFVLLTVDSLSQPLILNTEAGCLALVDSLGRVWESVSWGVSDSTDIASPPPGTSICKSYVFPEGVSCYFDASPSLGDWNDETNTHGSCSGTVVDENGDPLEDATVLYGYGFTLSTATNHEGVYSFESLAKRIDLRVMANGIGDISVPVQIYPDSSVEYHATILPGMAVDETVRAPRDFQLKTYPNPFNQDVQIQLQVQVASPFTLKVYNLKGSLVTTLDKGYVEPGNYRYEWRSGDCQSGVYVLHLDTPSQKMTQKLLLLK